VIAFVLAALLAQQQSLSSALEDPLAFPAPDLRAREFLGYASPWTLLVLALGITLLAALVKRFDPRRRRRVRRITILYMLYLTTFALSVVLGLVHAEGWARRTWFLADLFEVLVVIDFIAILLFDVVLLALRLEVANIVHDIALGAAYILAMLGILHRSGVNLSGIIATSAVVTAVLGLSLQATLANVLGGIALQLDDSLHVGDWLQLPNGVQGKIVAIRWRHTLVETRNWDTIVVPNASLLAENITILGLRTDQPVQHRMWVYFNVDFRHSPEEVINVVEEALQSAPIPNVATVPQPNCICYDFARQGADSFGYYAVRYWLTELASDDPTSSAVRVRIYAALKRAGIPLAVPGQAVWVTLEDKEREARKLDREMHLRITALEKVEMFACLSNDDRRVLAEAMKPAPFGRGEVITRQDSVAHWLYVLTRGECEVRVHSDGVQNGTDGGAGFAGDGRSPQGGAFNGGAGFAGDGRSPQGGASNGKLVARLAAPNVFGEMGVMTGERRTASVIAATEVDCYRIDKEAFRTVLRRTPSLVDSISHVMAHRRVELQGVREDLDAETKKQRVRDEHRHLIASIQNFFGLDAPASH
jgi:small-conductance mechanosensitive channel/CRP-like cAMP-binding protein